MEFLILLIVIVIAVGLYRTQKLAHSADQKAFLAGKVPDVLPDGFLKGSVKGWSGSWKGKKFDAASTTGINVFGDAGKEETKYPFKLVKGKGLLDTETDVLRIDYSGKENPWWLRRILDEVVEVAPGKYLGKMHIRVIPGAPFTGTFFRLEK